MIWKQEDGEEQADMSRCVVYYVVYYKAMEKSRPMMLLRAMLGIMAM